MENDSWTQIGRRVRHLRKANGLTLKQLSLGSGLSANAISLIERGEVAPTVATLCKIAHALGVPPGSLFQEVCPSEPAMRTAALAPCQKGSAKFIHTDITLVCITGLITYKDENCRHTLNPGERLTIDGAQPYCLGCSSPIAGLALILFSSPARQPEV